MTWPSIDHSILSPSGRVSKRARKAALARAYAQLFPDGLPAPVLPQVDERERLIRQAAQLAGDLAKRGMCPRKYVKEAARLEALADVS